MENRRNFSDESYDRAEARADQGVGNIAESLYREGASDDLPLRRQDRKPNPSRKRPLGRAYREPSDSDLDPNWSAPVERPTDEQLRINLLGLSAARAALRLHNEARVRQEGESQSDRSRRIAIERARDERRAERLRRGY